MRDTSRRRLLLLLPTTTYRADAFVDAARRIDVDLTVASELPSSFSDENPSGLLTLDLSDPVSAARAAADFAKAHPVSAVFGVDDDTAVAAAAISRELGLPHNPLQAVEAARDKYRQRILLERCGIPGPRFSLHDLASDPRMLATELSYPCVLKPLALSASRGVIRADNPSEFLEAHTRLAAILRSTCDGSPGDRGLQFLVESFVSGPEFAIEGLLFRGSLHVFAVFDKPDPLEGPFFEESIYLTPSRHPPEAIGALVGCAESAAQALGLERGPIHAELRYNDGGPWLIELAARPIGGKCGRVLRFGGNSEHSLEEVLLRDSLRILDAVPGRAGEASGVMMIPTPRAGILEEVRGVPEARSVPRVDDVLITAHRGQELVPLPEGSRYLGFIFARGGDPGEVEGALREAHGRLRVAVRGKGAGSGEKGED